MISKVVISKLCDKIQGGCGGWCLAVFSGCGGTRLYSQDMVALGCILSTQKAEAGRLKVQDQPGTQS